MRNPRPSQLSGFTLIELVVTIVILGIVGVVALSKFQATRFWFLMFEVPPPVIARTDTTSAGWAMYTGGGGCGVGASRCWKYRLQGTELAVITYRFNTGTITLVKNF